MNLHQRPGSMKMFRSKLRIGLLLCFLLLLLSVGSSMRSHHAQCGAANCDPTKSEMPSTADQKAAKALEKAFPQPNVRLSWNGQWGCVAARKVHRGDELVAVRYENILTVQHAELLHEALRQQQGAIVRHAGIEHEHEDDTYNRVMLVLLLLVEKAKGVHSHWATYIAMLPSIDRLTSLAYFKSAEANCLPKWQNKMWELFIKMDRGVWRAIQFVARITGLFAEMPTESEVKWANNIAMTRGFGLEAPWRGGLIPLMDMCNHHFSGIAAKTGKVQGTALSETLQGAVNLPSPIDSPLIEETRELHVLLAAQDLEEGDEVFNNYGDYSAQDLLVRYGYVPKEPALVTVDALMWARNDGPGSCTHAGWNSQICLVDANMTKAGFGCTKFHPHKVLQAALATCTGESYTMPLSRKLLREALLSTIISYEEEDARCKRLSRGSKQGHFPLVHAMRRTSLAGLRSALEREYIHLQSPSLH